MSAPDVRALARAIVLESASPDPDVMVMDLMAQLRPEQYEDALRSLARHLIREVIRDQRMRQDGTAPGQRGSRKVAAARDAWKRLLNTPEFVPSAGWIFLRDASREQVLEMAGVRVAKSRDLAAAADRYKRLASAMQEKGVMRVSDLPDDTLSTLLEGQANAA